MRGYSLDKELPNSNPSFELYSYFEDDILYTRKRVFQKLFRISPIFSQTAQALHSKRLSIENVPSMGEMFPWIINALVPVDRDKTEEIASGWLSIYLYTLFLDDYFDSPSRLTSSEFITGSLLAKNGLFSLYKIVLGTKYEGMVEEALFSSAIGQYEDIKSKSTEVTLDEVVSFSENKNKILLACAGAFAAAALESGELIVSFTRNLLLAYQYLDDIGDWKIDVEQRSQTLLLKSAAQNLGVSFDYLSGMSSEDVAEALVVTGALRRVLCSIVILLDKALDQSHQARSGGDVNLIQEYLRKVISTTNKTIAYIEQLETVPISSDPKMRRVTFAGIERHLRILAQST